MGRISRDELHSEILSSVSKRGTCRRLQVGALLVKDNRIINTGFNGPEKGAPECTDEYCDINKSCTRAVHAEINIIANCAKHGIPTKGTTIWVGYNPCPACSRAIIQAGIKEVVYIKEFRDTSGLQILGRAKVNVRQYGRPHTESS